MTEPVAGAIEVRPLTRELAQDYLAFFDHRSGPAFADNTEWAKCYCQLSHADGERLGGAHRDWRDGHGPLRLFIDAGFGMVRDDANMTVVRKALTPP